MSRDKVAAAGENADQVRTTLAYAIDDDKPLETPVETSLLWHPTRRNRTRPARMNDRRAAIAAAIQAAESALLLTGAEEIVRAAENWGRCEALGIDTEFVRERTYSARLGLVQISDGRTVWLLDPLVPGALEPLAKLLREPRIDKIFHSPSEDLEVLQLTAGALPEPHIDTQLACALLGQPLQVGYHKAVEWLLDIEIEKEQTRSNWCARPLRPEQLRYAALDVAPLPLIWSLLEQKLLEKDRLAWFREDCERQLSKARSIPDPKELWQRIKGSGRLDGLSLAILQELARWREDLARDKDLPRGFILPDPVLVTIADRKIQRTGELAEIDGLHPKAVQRHGAAVCDRVQRAMQAGLELPPLATLSRPQRRQLGKLRTRVGSKADALGVEASLLATKRELEELVLSAGNEIPERLTGWRMDQITKDLLAILDGS